MGSAGSGGPSRLTAGGAATASARGTWKRMRSPMYVRRRSAQGAAGGAFSRRGGQAAPRPRCSCAVARV
eukprot:8979707-Alexandrium_andersonii.AAC.1